MAYLLTKYAVTAFLIVLVSEIAKRSEKVGALVSSLPIVTILVMFWLYFEKQSTEKIANHAYYTFWYVIPTLPMFILMPWMLNRGYHFGLALGGGAFITVICFAITALIAKQFNVHL